MNYLEKYNLNEEISEFTLLINDNYRVLFGDEITNYLKPVEEVKTQQATNFNGEPSAFGFNDQGFSGVVSDNYSFLDQTSDEMSAKGSGGLRQMHNYVLLNQNDTIETPPDNWSPDKVGNDVSLDKLIAQRNMDVPQQPPRM